MTTPFPESVPDADRDFFEEERRDPVVGLVESERIEVREGFAESVMARLGETRPRRRRFPATAVALGLAAALAAVAALLLAGSREAGTAASTLSAVGSLLSSALLAGAGLLGASWSFLTQPARAAFGDSPTASVVTAVALAGLLTALWMLLRRRRSTVTIRDPRR